MRPTVSEQLHETRRILADTLKPILPEGYAAQIVRLALANLQMLEAAWTDVLPFLHWDNETALSLLSALGDTVTAELADAIQQAEHVPAHDPLDVATAEARNEALQALLHRVIGESGPEQRRRIRDYLLERTGRYPMRPRAGGLANARPAKDL